MHETRDIFQTLIQFPQILQQQGLVKYSNDPEFVRYTSSEMQEALEMTREEMDRAAWKLLIQERKTGTPITLPKFKPQFQFQLDTDNETDQEEDNENSELENES